MTSAPIAPISNYFTAGAGKSAEMAATKTSDVSFAKAMENTAGKSGAINSTDAKNKPDTKTVEDMGRKVPEKNRDNIRQNLREGSDEKAVKAQDEGNEKVAESVEGKAEDVRNSIKEKLGVSDEQIDQAMEVLGISMQDLLNSDSVKNLMLELTETNEISLLTDENLYSDIKEIMQLSDQSVEEITEEFDLSREEFNQILSEMEKMPEETEKLTSENVLPDETGFEVAKDTVIAEKNGIDVDTEKNASDITDNKMSDGNTNENVVEAKRPEETDKLADEKGVKIEVNRNTEPQERSVANETKTETIAASKVQNTENETKSDNDGGEQQEPGNGLFNQTVQTTTTVDGNGNVVETNQVFTTNIRGEELMRQVTEYIKVNINADTTSMEMQLHPASLGTVNMQLQSQNGVVTAHLYVQDEAVKAALETQLMDLQETFNEQGHKVEAVEVSVANYDLDRGPSEDRGDRHERQTAGTGKARRQINLGDLSLEDLESMSEDDQLAARIMAENGGSVDYTA